MDTSLFLVATCLVGITAAHAQTDVSLFTDNSVMLVVSDTLPTVNSGILYDITPVDKVLETLEYGEDLDYEKLQKESDQRVQKLREKLEKDLKGRKYSVKEAPRDHDPYTINGYESDYSETTALRVELKTEEELKSLVEWLRQQGSVTGQVALWKQTPTPTAARDLTDRLFNQAHAKADRLAVLGGRKLGKLLAAEDLNTETAYGYEYPYNEGAVPVIRSMRFKFSLED